MESKPRYNPQITLGNILTLVIICGGGFGFFLKYNDRLISVEAAQVSSDRMDHEFKREVLQKLQDLQSDVREIRQASGVRWRELPPSPYKR